jgi:gamma-glutamyltranspeptidase/glutathione hydrolase
MLNNMLGEEDINPNGFFGWPADTRMTSMMAPTLLDCNEGRAVLGSGGSNRLRTAILQVVLRLVADGTPLHEAVQSPRLHLEDDCLHLEPGAWPDADRGLNSTGMSLHQWPEPNLFFGGVHAVWQGPDTLQAAGDPRRAGSAIIL